eukprot:16442565-Heterocapsa_arctica.AAC.1
MFSSWRVIMWPQRKSVDPISVMPHAATTGPPHGTFSQGREGGFNGNGGPSLHQVFCDPGMAGASGLPTLEPRRTFWGAFL